MTTLRFALIAKAHYKNRTNAGIYSAKRQSITLTVYHIFLILQYVYDKNRTKKVMQNRTILADKKTGKPGRGGTLTFSRKGEIRLLHPILFYHLEMFVSFSHSFQVIPNTSSYCIISKQGKLSANCRPEDVVAFPLSLFAFQGSRCKCKSQ